MERGPAGTGVRRRWWDAVARRGSERWEDGGGRVAWLDRGIERRKRVREKHAHVGASSGVRRGRRQLGGTRRVIELRRSVLDAVTLAVAAVLFPRLACVPALVVRRVVARVRPLEALPARWSPAVALELARCVEGVGGQRKLCGTQRRRGRTSAEVARDGDLLRALALGP